MRSKLVAIEFIMVLPLLGQMFEKLSLMMVPARLRRASENAKWLRPVTA